MIDFVVIGGGVAGISVAARLSHLGSVTVLERETAIAYHASGRSAAMFEKDYGCPSVVALSRASGNFLFNANGGVLSPRGLMIVGGADTAGSFADDVAAMNLSPITQEEACAFVPILDRAKIDRAAYHDAAKDLDTDLLIQNFAKEIRANGGTIVTGAAVSGIRRGTAGWDVNAGEIVYTARHIVNAGGAWADDIAILAGIAPIGLRPFRRSMARISAPGGHDVSDWPMVFGPGETWYAKPDAGALIVSPAEEDLTTPHDAWADDMVLAEGLDRYAQNVTVPVDRLLASWAGLRTFAPDRTLVLGPSFDDPTFYWCAGQGGYGFQTAPAASLLIADLVAGRTPDLDTAVVKDLSPQRFREIA